MNIEEREEEQRKSAVCWLDLFDLIRRETYNSSINRDTMNMSIKEWIDSAKKAINKEVGV